jgi:hypothetical protein
MTVIGDISFESNFRRYGERKKGTTERRPRFGDVETRTSKVRKPLVLLKQ